jgi:hypothetical protein
VQACRPRERPAQVALLNAKDMRVLPASIKDARDQSLAPQAP